MNGFIWGGLGRRHLAMCAFAAVFTACSLPNFPGASNQSPTPTRTTLEACGQLKYGADGNASPIICPDGRPNQAADRYFRKFSPALTVVRLGADASPSDVQAAMCADWTTGTTGPIEESAYRLAKAEEGWQFAVDPSTASCAIPTPSPSPVFASQCAIRYQGHDATVIFDGFGATEMCNNWQGVDGSWTDVPITPTMPGSLICSQDKFNGLSWRVIDSGGAYYGGQACSSLNRWVHGGPLTVP